MKICTIQPRYSFCENDVKKCFEDLLALMDKCDDSMDIIVLPEYSDAPADVKGKGGFYDTVREYGPILLKKAIKQKIKKHLMFCLVI